MPPTIRAAPWILLIAGFLLFIAGFMVNTMWAKITWTPTLLLAGLGIASLMLAVVASRLFRCRLATSAAIVWLFGLTYFAGIAAVLSVAMITIAAIAVGSCFVEEDRNARLPLSILAGLAVLCGVTGWLLPFPVHGHAAYVLVLLLIVVFRRRAVVNALRPLRESWSDAVAGAPRVAALAVLVMGVVSTCAWVPTIHYDDLAYHLGLPYQLQGLGYYRMDAGSRVWALSAWAGDVLQGIVQVIAGVESRGAVDTLWLVLTATLMWSLGGALNLSSMMRWFAVAIYASVPLTADTLTGMQTEGATAAIAVGVALLIQQALAPSRRLLVLLALLFGLLLGLKVSNLMIAGPLGLWLLWQWRWRFPWRALPLAVLTVFLVGGSSYLYAYLLANNPVLPIFNNFFHSVYYPPVSFHDLHWDTGFHWNILWQLVFHTTNYIEGGYNDGVAGFALIALLGSLLIALFRRDTRAMALVATAAFLLPLTQIQYLRYAEPAMALLMPVMLSGVPLVDWRRLRARTVPMLLVALVLVDLAYAANANWQMRNGVLQDLLADGQSAVIAKYAPTRVMAKFIRVAYGEQARTLMLDDRSPFAAELAGNAFVTNWYDLELSTLASGANGDVSGAKWAAVFDRSGADLITLATDMHTQALDAAIEKTGGVKVRTEDKIELWELHRGKPGTVVPIAPYGVNITFDTSAAPATSTIAHADLTFGCVAKDVPIVISWKLTREDKSSWQRSEWINCNPAGTAGISLDQPIAGKLEGMTITASPATPVDLHLQSTATNAWFGADLSYDRDLALQWRSNIVTRVKAWNQQRLQARKAKR
ncbi:hypothetical protein B0E48_12935 [Rhodanobacter sp. C03]|nr:hypothetical protein B0E48_12935 [Rhodanobacter sp. C03]